jgi:GNAT superfamily N-acetyltransferase
MRDEYEFRQGRLANPDDDYPFNTPKFDDPHRVVVRKEGREIGQLSWSPRHGEITDVFVDKEHRRKGIAGGMFSHAAHISSQFDTVPPPHHSPHRTAEGDAWARAVGGNLPEQQPYTRQFNNLWNE